MTHEEVVASLAASEIHSHRQLPRLVFQIQMKWRDDPRPRAGLIRTREFAMKDSYSLDADEAGLDAQYQRHYRAYFRIFGRCGLPVVAVGSDVGMMGGSAAHEYMYLTPLGEDTLVLCDSCGYAAEPAGGDVGEGARRGGGAAAGRDASTPRARPRSTSSPPSSASSRRGRPRSSSSSPSTAARTARPRTQPVVAVVRGDTSLNESKLGHLLDGAELRPMNATELDAIGAVGGFASPIGLTGATVIADQLVMDSPNLVAGANEADWHLLNTNAGRDWQPSAVADVAAADEGDPCSVCGEPLRTVRGVEVANIFKLGTRYSEALGANYLDPDGNERPVVMGSYGIGVGRLLACVAEEHHDEQGLRLPVNVAPFPVHLAALGGSGTRVADAAELLYAALGAAGVEVLFDDRDERAGVQVRRRRPDRPAAAAHGQRALPEGRRGRGEAARRRGGDRRRRGRRRRPRAGRARRDAGGARRRRGPGWRPLSTWAPCSAARQGQTAMSRR